MHDNARSIYANAGHIVFFADGVGDSFKDDVLSSSLYLQLAASSKYSRFDDFDKWCSLYVSAMPRFGWVLTGQNSYRHRLEGETSLTVWNQISNRLGGKVSAGLFDKVGRFLVDQEAAEEVNAAILLFREHAVSVRSTAQDAEASVEEASLSLIFSFVSCEHLVTSVFLAFKTTEPVKENLFSQVFVSEKMVGNLQAEVVFAEISEHHYRRVRERLNAELGARKQKLILKFNKVSP
ncbi:MAG: Uncharacterized protein JWP80_1870 [Pseudomonas sp.]|nr:Uncharacterized protein [Pseudomonas sp.]